MPNRLAVRWPLILIGIAALGLVSCGPPNKPPPAVDDGVTVRVIVDGPGRIGSPPTYTCPDDCEWVLPADEVVAVIAFPSPSNVFVGWEGPCETLNATCSRAFEEGDVVTARFARHALRLDLTGDGEGVFTVTGGGITETCDADCGLALPTLSYAIQYAAQGTSGTTLGAWGGACENAALPEYCLVQVSGSTDVSKTWRRPPVAIDDADYEVDAGATLTVAAPGVLANDDDTDGDTLTAQFVGGALNGTLSLASNGGFSYAPNPGFSGEDAFTYRVRDTFGNLSNTATVTITVTAVNEAPIAEDDAYATDEDTDLVVPAPGVLGNDSDPDGDDLTVTLGTDVTSGTLDLQADGSFTYTPDADFFGEDTFIYVANDGGLTSAPATVIISVTAVDDAPVAVDDAYSTSFETALVVIAPGVLDNDTDPDGDPLTAALDTDGTNGTLVLDEDGSFSYTPDPGFADVDTFTYTASDGLLTSAPATVTITVAPED